MTNLVRNLLAPGLTRSVVVYRISDPPSAAAVCLSHRPRCNPAHQDNAGHASPMTQLHSLMVEERCVLG